jgi:hypothetical protein
MPEIHEPDPRLYPEHTTVDALQETLRLLLSLSDHQVDLHTWGEKGDCGTVACAMGWAGGDPWFNKRGFHRYDDNFVPRYMYRSGWTAISDFFKSNGTIVHFLFDENEYSHHKNGPPRLAVIARTAFVLALLDEGNTESQAVDAALKARL